MIWNVDMAPEFVEWLLVLDAPTYAKIMAAIAVLREEGPSLGRPLVDTVIGSRYANMKELRPPSQGRQAIRLLFAFDPVRNAIFLVGGDKANDWNKCYRRNIPIADERFERHLRELGDRT